MSTMKAMVNIAAVAVSGLFLATAPAKAGAVVVGVVAPLTPVTAVVGGAAIIAGHEAFARKPYGNNGEGMKLIRGAGKAIGKIRIKKVKW